MIEEQRAAALRLVNPDARIYYWPWGFAWLISFTVFFLRYGPGGRVFVDLPGWLPFVVMIILILAAGAVAGIGSARAYRHIEGDSSRRGLYYGLSWSVGFASLFTVAGRITEYVPDDLKGLLWAGIAVGLTGVLHMAGGAIFLDRYLFALGLWISLINLAGVFVGPGWHSLIVAVLGGGGMIVAGSVLARRQRAWR
jgi:uncharacterized membrane protein YecN with MAPEG domain